MRSFQDFLIEASEQAQYAKLVDIIAPAFVQLYAMSPFSFVKRNETLMRIREWFLENALAIFDEPIDIAHLREYAEAEIERLWPKNKRMMDPKNYSDVLQDWAEEVNRQITS